MPHTLSSHYVRIIKALSLSNYKTDNTTLAPVIKLERRGKEKKTKLIIVNFFYFPFISEIASIIIIYTLVRKGE